MIRYKLGELIAEKQFQEKRRVTLDEISKVTGIHRATLSKLLNQHGYNTTLDVVERLCKYFNVDISDLVSIVDDPKPEKSD